MTFSATGTTPGELSNGATELSEYVVDFEKCNTIKSQILVDFIAPNLKQMIPHKSPYVRNQVVSSLV
jgi:hypothetical protein